MKKDKKEELLQFLKQNHDWINAQTIADYLHVSTRTVRKYISELNSNNSNDELIESSNTGYRINNSFSTQHKNTENKINSIQTPSKRMYYILHHLIIYRDGIDIFDLSEDLYVSVPTIEKDLQKCREYIKEYKLQIDRIRENLKLVGSEENKRRLMSSIYYEELNTNFYRLIDLEEMFGYDLKTFRKQLIHLLSKYGLDINEYTIGNILLHIVISVERIKENRFLPEDFTFGEQQEISNVTLDVARLIKEHFTVILEEAELSHLNALIRSKTIIKTDSQVKNSLKNYVNQHYIELVKDIITKVNDYYYVDLNDEEFIYRFTLHVKNMKERSSTGFLARNPLTSTVKASSPIIYDLAVFISNIIAEKENLELNEDEIAYIAFHVGSCLELKKASSNLINCILICPEYYDIPTEVKNKIERVLGNDLKIDRVLTSLDNISNLNSDLILSTIDLGPYGPSAYIRISPFVKQDDINAIKLVITRIKKGKTVSYLKKQLMGLFDSRLFERNKYFNDKIEVIRYLGEKMVRLDMVSRGFINDVIKRENLSSTAFNNVAVPHSMQMNAEESSIAILINDNPMNWGDNEGIQVISLIAMNKNKRKIYRDIFDDYIKVLAEPGNAKALSECENYDSFIEKLSQLIEDMPY